MRLKSTLAALGLAVAFGLAMSSTAEACCRRGPPPGWWGPQPVSHFVYYPRYYNAYYLATFPPSPTPYVYMPLGYWPRYERPYWRYHRRYWARRPRGCCAAPVYAVPQPVPVPVVTGGCCNTFLK
jgi:hypothetical protein